MSFKIIVNYAIIRKRKGHDMNLQKLISHVKVLHPLTLFANVSAAFIAIFIAFMPFIHEKNFGIVIALFFGTSFAIQTWFYVIKDFKESKFANPKYVASERFTPKLLDQYASFNYKFWGFMKVGTIILLAFTLDYGWFFYFLFFYNLMALFIRNFLYSRKKLPVPDGYITTTGKHFEGANKIKIPKYDFANKQATGTDLIKYE